MGCCTPRAEEALTLCVCVTVNSSTRYSSTPDYSEYIFMVSALSSRRPAEVRVHQKTTYSMSGPFCWMFWQDIHDVKYPLSVCSMLLDCCGWT
ncbi:hypothetical protein Plhal703r1_c39g0136221 [Plasmopara halstedii]